MFAVPFARLVCAAFVFSSASASADTIDIDLHGAIERAHRTARAAIAARGRVREAEGRIAGAEVTFTTNPELEGGAGPRFSGSRPIDAELRLGQELEPWRRGPRRRLARAEASLARAEVGAQLRELDLEVALAFYDAERADREIAVSTRAVELATRGATAAERRRKAGEITDLDANLAKAALGRARAAAAAATSERTVALGRLAALIGAQPDDVISVRGELKPGPLPSGTAETRADVVALDRERDAAIAEGEQASAEGRPNAGIWVGYQREDSATILLAGLRFTLPIWNRAQGPRAVAAAKERRVGETRDATLRLASREIADAVASYTAAATSVATFEQEVLPVLDDSDQLLDKMLDAGQIAVTDLLFARQELLASRREYLDRLLALAKASALARHAMGVSP